MAVFPAAVLANVVSDVKILRHGVPVESVAPGRAVPTDVSVALTLAESDFDELVVDLSQMNLGILREQYRSLRVKPEDCSEGVCVIEGLVLLVDSPGFNVTVEALRNGSRSVESFFVPLTLDVDKPVVKRFVTDFCVEDVCFLPSGSLANVTVEMENPTGSFVHRMVFVRVGGLVFGARECIGSICKTTAQVSCGEGAYVPVGVASLRGVPSQEDSGNPVEGIGGSFLCDATPPRIKEVHVTGPEHLGGAITAGGALHIEAVIEEENPGAVMEAVFKDGQTVRGACAKEEGAYVCSVDSVAGEVGTGEVTVIVYDIVGNAARQKARFSALELVNVENAPSLFSARVAGAVQPSSISRAVLSFTNEAGVGFPVFVPFMLEAKAPGAHVLRIGDAQCSVLRDGEVAASALEQEVIANPAADVREKNRLDFVIKGFSGRSVNELGPSMEVLCSFNVIGRVGKRVLNKPQRLNITFSIGLTSSVLGDPGQAFVEKVKKAEGAAMLDWTWIGKAQRILEKVGNVCGLYDQAVAISALLGNIKTGFVDPLANVPGGQAAAAKGAKAVAESELQSSLIKSKWSDTLRDVCGAISCKNEWAKTKKYTDAIEQLGVDCNPDDGPARSLLIPKEKLPAELTKDLTVPNLHESLVASATCLCLPGVLENLDKWRFIQCDYLNCLKTQALYGADVSLCDELKSGLECKTVVGEVFNLPGVIEIKNVMSNIAAYIRALIPHLVLEQVLKGACAKADAVPGNWAGIWCHVPQTLASFQDIRAIGKPGSFRPVSYNSNSVCEQALCNGPHCSRQPFSLPNFEVDVVSRAVAEAGAEYIEKSQLADEYAQELNEEKEKELLEKLKESGFDLEQREELERLESFLEASAHVRELGKQIERLQKDLDRALKKGDKDKAEELREKLKEARNNFKNAKKEVNALYNDVARLDTSVAFTVKDNQGNVYTYDPEREVLLDAQGQEVKPDSVVLSSGETVMSGQVVLGEATPEQETVFISVVLDHTNTVKSTTVTLDNGPSLIISYDENGLSKEAVLLDEQGNKEAIPLEDVPPELLITESGKGGEGIDRFVNGCAEGAENCKIESSGERKTLADVLEENKDVLNEAKALEEARRNLEIVRRQARFAAYDSLVTMALGALFKKGQLDFLFPEALKKVARKVDPEEWKESLCNPASGVVIESPSQTTIVRLGSSGKASVAATIVGDFFVLNDSATVYSVLYFVSAGKEPVAFTIELEGDDGSLRRAFTDWKRLQPGQSERVSKSFVSARKYTRLCLVFNKPYPDGERDAKTRFCSAFKEDALASRGSPVVEQASSAASSSSSGGDAEWSGDL
ncbi:hypothetical protein D6783_05875 [Candidatus Woesearchaeota archaeon]|nr:MAG: hypothetical protein D6783_05875 [Candidatus Woesearchaeota archaeon]